MRVLSIDPGHTTGIACYSGHNGLEWSMSVNSDTWNGITFLIKLASLSKADRILVEGLPTKYVDDKTAAVFNSVKYGFEVANYPIVVVPPAAWKRLVKRVEIPGQHARDAATMAKWYIMKEQENV
jgi:hypothetical protein